MKEGKHRRWRTCTHERTRCGGRKSNCQLIMSLKSEIGKSRNLITSYQFQIDRKSYLGRLDHRLVLVTRFSTQFPYPRNAHLCVHTGLGPDSLPTIRKNQFQFVFIAISKANCIICARERVSRFAICTVWLDVSLNH